MWAIQFTRQIIFPLAYLLILFDKIIPKFFDVYSSFIKRIWVRDMDPILQVGLLSSHKGRAKFKTFFKGLL